MKLRHLFKKPIFITAGKQKVYDVHDQQELSDIFSKEERCVQRDAAAYYSAFNLSKKDVEEICAMQVPYSDATLTREWFSGTFRGHNVKIQLDGKVILDGEMVSMPEILDMFNKVIALRNQTIDPVQKVQRMITDLLQKEERIKKVKRVIFNTP